MEKYFLTQIKRTNGTFEKGCVVKDSLEDAKQNYHAYLGAYAYKHDPNTDYVSCLITNICGGIEISEVWNKIEEVSDNEENA